jgi:phage baseplate assembly protein W
MPSEIAVPFRLSTSYGIQPITSTERQVQQHVVSLVSTEPGERVMLPQYGVQLASLLFEEVDDIAVEHINDKVGAALNDWEPGVALNRAIPVQASTGEVRVDVDYARRDSGSTTATGSRVNQARILVGGEVKEVVRG